MIGWDGQQTTLLLRQFRKPMGIAVHNHLLALATQHEVVVLANAPDLAYAYLEDQPGRYDALYLPRVAYYTGDLNNHDIAFGHEGLWVVNTRFSCLATLSPDYSFVPRWQPSFIRDLVPEDRCHLNGLAMVAGQPQYVTALGATDHVGGWRSAKATGGIVMAVDPNQIVLHGLAMPHSPRWHHERLWFLNSGAGELCQADLQTGHYSVVATLPGFLRGLCCVGHIAIVGLCQIRERHIFGGLPVQNRFPQLLCGLAAIDLFTGSLIGMLEFTAGCQELGDIQFLAQVKRPTLLNREKPAVLEAFTAPGVSYWLRPSAQLPVENRET